MTEPLRNTPEVIALQQEVIALCHATKESRRLEGKFMYLSGRYQEYLGSQLGKKNPYATLLNERMSLKDTFLEGRSNFHIARLISQTRSPAERTFGQEFIDTDSDLFKTQVSKEKTNTQLRDLIGAESDNATMWWTIAPYAFRRLIQQGQDNEAAIKYLLNWIAKTELTNNSDDPMTLPTLEWLKHRDTFILENHVIEVSDSFVLQKKGEIQHIQEDIVVASDWETGKNVTTIKSNLILDEGFSDFEPGTIVFFLSNGEYPTAVTHDLADRIAQLMVVPYLLNG